MDRYEAGLEVEVCAVHRTREGGFRGSSGWVSREGNEVLRRPSVADSRRWTWWGTMLAPTPQRTELATSLKYLDGADFVRTTVEWSCETGEPDVEGLAHAESFGSNPDEAGGRGADLYRRSPRGGTCDRSAT